MQTLEECQTCANIKLRRFEKWERRISIGSITCSLPCPYCPVLALGFPLLLSNPLGSLLPQYHCNNPSLTGLCSHVGFSGRLQNWLKLMNTLTNCPSVSHSGIASIVVYPICFLLCLDPLSLWVAGFSLILKQLHSVTSFLWFLKQYDLEYVLGSFLFFLKKMTIRKYRRAPRMS